MEYTSIKRSIISPQNFQGKKGSEEDEVVPQTHKESHCLNKSH